MYYKICFKVSPFQEFDKGSLVTYRDENRLEYIKETLYSKTNFFYISEIDWENYTCEVSNYIDSIKTSPDQLIEIVAYLEKISNNKRKNSGSRLENIILHQEEIQSTYLLEDQKMSISLETSTIPEGYFDLINSVVSIDQRFKEYKIVRFKENIISDLF
jgi:hypothetical protein